MSSDTLTRSVIFAVSLAALLVGHQLGDHVGQTDHQAAHKTERSVAGWRAMAGHLFNYHLIVTGVLLLTAFALRLPLSPRGVAAGMVFSVVTHAWLDRRWPVRALLRATHSETFAETTTPVCGMYVADQALHRLALLLSALMIAGL
jgi:hypothetical protein